MIRPAILADIPALVRIENRCFDSDRLSRRSFRHLLTRGKAATLVEEHDGVIRGYVLVRFTSGTSMARLYSYAVDPDHQRQGVGRRLVAAAEQVARERDCITMRLEVRTDNAPSQELFRVAGYRLFGVIADYYEDHTEALRFERSLAPEIEPNLVRVPYFRQSLDFTCGPAALMMAMRALDPSVELDRKHELRIWRESTTIFMTSGHGGCGPYGLALAAHHRGFQVEMYVNDEAALFVDSVRSAEKKEVIRLVQEDQLQELTDRGIQVTYGPLPVAEMQGQFEAGGIPIALISSYRIYNERFPHWVVVTGFAERFIYFHDPFVDEELGRTMTDSINMPILKSDFERMARYGRTGQRAALILRKPVTRRRRSA